MTGKTLKENATYIVERLRASGYKAFIVGGAVRDMLINREPYDYDIATDAPLDIVAQLFDRTAPVGERFGVMLVIENGHAFEVARFRRDGIYLDGRRPQSVVPASETDDALRRDFTINGLLYDPLEDRIIDHVGGEEDIRRKIVRAIGDPRVRFAEDRLRVMRAVRLAARLDFTIDDGTFDAMCAMAPEIKTVSAERIGDELRRMVSGDNPDRAIKLLDKTGLLEILLPEVSALKGVGQPPQYHPEGDVYAHTLRMLGLFGGGSETLGFGVLLHDIAKPVTMTRTDRIRFNRHDVVGAAMSREILRRFRFSARMVSRVAALVKSHMRFAQVPDMKRSTFGRFAALEGFDEMLELYRLDCLASHGDITLYQEIIGKLDEDDVGGEIPKPLLNGHDLMALGYPGGPLLKTILEKMVDGQMEGTIRSREDALSFVREMSPPGLKNRNPKHKSNRRD